jgi:hypothetical protein
MAGPAAEYQALGPRLHQLEAVVSWFALGRLVAPIRFLEERAVERLGDGERCREV